MSLENTLSTLPNRYWSDIRQSWLNYIARIDPSTIQVPPNHTESIELHIAGQEIADYITSSTDYFRPEGFTESTYNLLKAVHILQGCETFLLEGRLTWTLSNAYMAATFAAKSISAILGICMVPSQGKKFFIIDTWADRTKKGQNAARNTWQPSTDIHVLANDIGHTGMWDTFAKVISKAKIDESVWPKAAKGQLNRLLQNPDIFSKQRTGLHYLNKWTFDDLLELKIPENQDFALVPFDKEFSKHRNFTYEAACLLSILALLLLKDVCLQSKHLEPIFLTLKSMLESGCPTILNRHQLYELI